MRIEGDELLEPIERCLRGVRQLSQGVLGEESAVLLQALEFVDEAHAAVRFEE